MHSNIKLICLDLDGTTLKDISNILDMNENTVKTNLYKALKILKINLEEEGINV